MTQAFKVQSINTDLRNMSANMILTTQTADGKVPSVHVHGVDISSLADLKASEVDEAAVKLCREFLRKAADASYE